jgi:hypothetical protein
MRILLDQGTPAPLRRELTGHVVVTAYEQGWSTLENGDLLTAAEANGFDLIVSTDKNVRHQQNLADRRLAILVLPTTSWPIIRMHVVKITEAVAATRPGSYTELRW